MGGSGPEPRRDERGVWAVSDEDMTAWLESILRAHRRDVEALDECTTQLEVAREYIRQVPDDC